MKKIPALFAILALLIMNIASVTCVYEDYVVGSGVNVAQSSGIFGNDNIPLKQLVQCNQCCCHASSLFHDNMSAYVYDSLSTSYFIFRDDAYLSALNSPPFQPPKS